MPKRKLTRSGDTPRRYKKKPRKHHIVNQTVAQVQSKQVVEKNNMAFPVSPLVNRGRGVSTPTSKVGNQKQADLFNKAMATAHIKPKNKPSQTPVLTSVPQSLRRNDVGVQGKGPAVHEQMSIRVPSSLLNSNCPISALPSSVIESLVQGATPNQPRVVTIIRMGSGGSVGSRETVTLTPQVTNASSSKIIVASSGKNANTISTVKGQIMGTSSPSQVVSKVDMQDTGCHKDALSPTKHKKHKTQYDTARTQTTRTLDQGRRSSNRVRILTYKAAEAEDSRRVNTQTKSSGPRKPNLGSENLLTVNDDLAQSSDKTVTASDREIEIICDEFSTKSSNPDLAHISRTKSTSQKFGDDENTFMHTKSTDHLAVEELQIREDHDNTVLAGAREEKQTVRADEGVQESPREDRRQLTSVGIQVDDSDMFPWQQVSLETDQGGVDLMRPQAVESSSSSSTVPPLKALLTEALEKKSKRPTAYTLYCNVHRAKLVAENPGIDLSDFSQISRRLGQMWQTLTKKEKWCWRRKAKRLVTLLSTGKGNKPKLSAIPTVGPAASTAPAAPAAPNLPASKPMMLHQGARIAKATVKESTLSPIMKYNDDMKGRPKHSTSVHRSSVATTVVTSATVARDVNEDTLSTIVEKCVTVPQQFVGHIIMPSYPINVLTQSQAIAMETKEKDFALAESLSSDIKLEPEVSVDETGTESKAILENQTMPKLESNGSSIEVNARVKIEPEVSSDETGTESKTFLENQNIPNLESNDSSIDVDAKIKIEPEVSSDEIGTEQKVILEGQNIPRLELINPSIDMEPEVYIDRDDVDGQVIERDKDADGQVYIERDNDTDGQVIERDKDADGQVYIDRDKDADGQVYIERDNDADSKTVDDRESTNRINLKRRKVKRRCSASPMRKKKTTLDEEKLNKDLSGLHSQRDENSADVSRYQNAERNQDTDYKECEEEGDDDSVDEDMSKRKQGTNKRELHDAKTLREESWFGCIHCPMAFRTLNNYYKHVKKHPTYNKKRDNLFWIKNRDQWKVSTCTACGIHYPDKEGLKAHCKRKGCPTFKKNKEKSMNQTPHSQSKGKSVHQTSYLTRNKEKSMNQTPHSQSKGKSVHQTSYLTRETDGQPLTVMTTNNSKEKRVWDKKHVCVFCMNSYAKLSRHLEQSHPNERDVAKALSYPKHSHERSRLFELIRNKGDFTHNHEVLRTSRGILIPYKRPSNEVAPTEFIFCEDCLGLFIKSDIWKHKKCCAALPTKRKDKAKRGLHQAGSAALMPMSEESTSKFSEDILQTMSNDITAFVARKDNLIVTFGMKIYAKIGHKKYQHQYIRQKMRELARLLCVIREIRPELQSLADIIHPTIFKTVIEAVKKVTQYNSDDGAYRTPSLAMKLGYSLKKCAMYMRSQAIQSEDTTTKQHAENFIELVECDWYTEIACQVAETLHSAAAKAT